MANWSCVWVAVYFSFFARTPQNAAANNTGRNNPRTRHPGKSTRDQGPTNRRRIYAVTRDFLTLTREKCHGSSRPDPHETRISRVTRIVTGQVRSGQEDFKISRVGSGRVKRFSKSRGSGRVGSGQEVFKISWIGSGRVKKPQNSRGSPDPIRPARFDPTREI